MVSNHNLAYWSLNPLRVWSIQGWVFRNDSIFGHIGEISSSFWPKSFKVFTWSTVGLRQLMSAAAIRSLDLLVITTCYILIEGRWLFQCIGYYYTAYTDYMDLAVCCQENLSPTQGLWFLWHFLVEAWLTVTSFSKQYFRIMLMKLYRLSARFHSICLLRTAPSLTFSLM